MADIRKGAGVGTAAKVRLEIFEGRLFFKTDMQIIDSNNKPMSLDLWDFTLSVKYRVLHQMYKHRTNVSNTSLTGTFNLTRLALQHLVSVTPEEGPDGERGVVILVSSSAAVGVVYPFQMGHISLNV